MPVLGWCLKRAGHISINRTVPDSNAIRLIHKRFSQKRVIGYFPEGTRSNDGRLQKPKRGLGYLVWKTRSVVLPCYIWGTDRILKKNNFVPSCNPIKIIIGEPVDFAVNIREIENCQDRETEKAMLLDISEAAMSLIAGLRAELLKRIHRTEPCYLSPLELAEIESGEFQNPVISALGETIPAEADEEETDER